MASPSDDLTPAWFTSAMSRSGVLTRGKVTSSDCSDTGAFNSRTVRATLSYSTDAAPDLPEQLIVKRNAEMDWSMQAGALEVCFYDTVRTQNDHPAMIPHCYAASYDKATRQSYLLLADLTDTHRPPVTRDQQISIIDGVPADDQIMSCVDALADLHAYWWEHPYSRDDGPFSIGYGAVTHESFLDFAAACTKQWRHVRAANQTWLPADALETYDAIIANLESFWRAHRRERFEARTHLTLTHGDSYLANFLCPRDPGGGTYLIDWQSPEFEVGALDLANLCATFWSRGQRSEGGREQAVLRRYHERLSDHGIRDYSIDDLHYDYQVAVAVWTLIPVQDAFDGSARAYWWPKMRCLLDAFADHDCRVLFTA